MRFPYFQVGPKDFAPIIPLKLFGKNGWIGFEAYIDSGASLSIFNSDRADILGIDYTKGKSLHVTVGDGGLIAVYVCKVRVQLAGGQFRADIGFSPQLGVGFNLLGRRSFFEKFKICFDDARKFVELHPIDAKL